MYGRPINRRQTLFTSDRLITILLLALAMSCGVVCFARTSQDDRQESVASEGDDAPTQDSGSFDAIAQEIPSDNTSVTNEERSTPTTYGKTPISSKSETSNVKLATNGRHGTSSSILQSFSALAIILGVIVVLGVLTKRMSSNPSRSSKTIETLDQTVLDRKWRLHTIRWGTRVLLIATGGDSCVKLAEVSDQAEIDELLKTRLNSK